MVYVSTACLQGMGSKFEKDLFRVLDVYKDLNINQIELGSVHSHMKNLQPLYDYQAKNNTDFILHGLFPPTKTPFMLNAASQGSIHKKTMAVVKEGIEVCRKLNSDLYGFHGGYYADISLDVKKLSPFMDHDTFFFTLVETMQEICDFAAQYDIMIGVENMIAGYPEFALVHESDLLNLFKAVKRKNVGMILDLGHLGRTALLENFDPANYIKKMDKHVVEIHCHQVVDGKDHQAVTDVNILKGFSRRTLRNAKITLESNGLTENQIAKSFDVLQMAALQ